MNLRLQRLLERILICSTVTSLFISSLLIIKVISNVAIPSTVSIINWFDLVVCGVSGIIFMIVLDIFVTEKTQVYIHIVFLFFYQLLIMGLSFISNYFYTNLVLLPVNIFLYILEASLNEMFLYHENFQEQVEGKNGKELIEHLFHNNLAALEFGQRTKKLQGWLFVMGLVQFLFIAICKILGGRITPLILLFTITFYLSLFFLFVIIGMYNKETYYGFLGFSNISDNLKPVYKKSLLILFISLIFGIGLSSNKAILKIDKLNELKFQSGYTSEFNYFESTEINDYYDDFDIEQFLPERKEPGILLDIFFAVVKYSFFGLVIILLIYFLIKPFFSKGWKEFWKQNKLYKLLKKFWNEFKGLISVIFSREKDENAYATVESKKFRDSISDILKGSKKSKQKKTEIDRLTKKFMMLIDWGSKRDIKYTKNLAPAEYTVKITKVYDGQQVYSWCKTVGNIYEKALYDKELLTNDEESLFDSSLKSLLSLERR